MRRHSTQPHRFAPALIAGAIAIVVNTGLLAACDAVGFVTARGGLLRLVRDSAGKLASHAGLADVWTNVLAPATSGAAFQTGFHLFVGLVMALVYAYLLESVLPGRPWLKGVLYAVLVWLVNALVVLPLTGEGIAGSSHLGIANMIGFAVVHTVFFVLLAILYARWHSNPRAIL